MDDRQYTANRGLALVFLAAPAEGRHSILMSYRPRLLAFITARREPSRGLSALVEVLVKDSDRMRCVQRAIAGLTGPLGPHSDTDGESETAGSVRDASTSGDDAMDAGAISSDSDAPTVEHDNDGLRRAVGAMVDAMDGVVEALGLTHEQVENFVDSIRHLRRERAAARPTED